MIVDIDDLLDLLVPILIVLVFLFLFGFVGWATWDYFFGKHDTLLLRKDSWICTQEHISSNPIMLPAGNGGFTLSFNTTSECVNYHKIDR